MSGQEYTELLGALGDLKASVEAVLTAQQEARDRANRFWAQDWPGVQGDIRDLDKRVRKLEIDLSGAPKILHDHTDRISKAEQFQAKIGAWAAAGSLIGSIVVQILMKIFLG